MTIIPSSTNEDIQCRVKQLFPQASPKTWELLKDADMRIIEDKKTGKKSLAIDTENPELKKAIRKALQQRENIIEIGKYLAELPEKSLLAIAYTNALRREWHRRRNRNYWLANFFIANSLRLDSELLIEGATEELGKWGYEIAYAHANLLRKQWELIDAAHPHLRKFLQHKFGVEYPFKSSRDLLFEIRRDEEATRFANYTSEFWDIDTQPWTEVWRSIASGHSRPSEKPKTLSPFKHPRHWLDVVLLFAPLIAAEKRIQCLEHKLAGYFREIEAYAQTLAAAGEARSASGKVAKSVTWIDGVPHVAGRGGTRYPTEL
jgi:hypothetical protein